MKQFLHVVRKLTISLMTIFIGSEIIFCVMRVFLSIDTLRSGATPVFALQSNNSMGELGFFHHLKQRSREPNLTKKGQQLNCVTLIQTL